MRNISTPYANKLREVNASVLLRAMSSPQWTSNSENLSRLKEINGANEEMDRIRDIGLTVKFDQARLLVVSEGIEEWFGATGEFYVITSVIDGSGKQFDYKTQFFQGIRRNDFLPLGEGGMLVSFLKDPRWFIDIHMLVMENIVVLNSFGKTNQRAKNH